MDVIKLSKLEKWMLFLLLQVAFVSVFVIVAQKLWVLILVLIAGV